jgi:hypothetical protein
MESGPSDELPTTLMNKYLLRGLTLEKGLPFPRQLCAKDEEYFFLTTKQLGDWRCTLEAWSPWRHWN